VRAREALARDALLLASVRDSVVVTDLDGRVTYWNEGATRLFGWSAEEMVGRPAYEVLLSPEDWGAMQGRNGQRAQGAADRYEIQIHCKDRRRLWIEVHATPYRDATGQVVGTLTSV